MLKSAKLWGHLLVVPSLALFCSSGARPASGIESLTLRQAVERALEQHPSIGASRAGRDEARAAVDEAMASWYPTLRLSGSATRYEQPMPVSPIHGFRPGEVPPFSESVLQGGLAFTYILFDGAGRLGRVRLARAKAATAEVALDAAQQLLIARVISAYLDVLSKKQILDAEGRRLAALQAERARIGQLLDAGRAAPLQALRVDAAIASAEADRVRMSTGLDAAERELARMLDWAVEETRADRLEAVALCDTTPPQRHALVALALKTNPSLQQARDQLLASRASLMTARSARWPELRLVGNYLDYAGADGDQTFEWNAGVQLSFPIFTGGAIRKGIARADAASRGAGEQIRLAEIQLQQDIDRALSAVDEARARVVSLDKAVTSFDEVARIEKLSLEAGSGTLTDYLDAEADLLAARANLVDARYREIIARAELARIAGMLSRQWLVQTLEEAP